MSDCRIYRTKCVFCKDCRWFETNKSTCMEYEKIIDPIGKIKKDWFERAGKLSKNIDNNCPDYEAKGVNDDE